MNMLAPCPVCVLDIRRVLRNVLNLDCSMAVAALSVLARLVRRNLLGDELRAIVLVKFGVSSSGLSRPILHTIWSLVK